MNYLSKQHTAENNSQNKNDAIKCWYKLQIWWDVKASKSIAAEVTYKRVVPVKHHAAKNLDSTDCLLSFPIIINSWLQKH